MSEKETTHQERAESLEKAIVAILRAIETIGEASKHLEIVSPYLAQTLLRVPQASLYVLAERLGYFDNLEKEKDDS